MSADNLESLTDTQLSETFAVEVAGWTRGWTGYYFRTWEAGQKKSIAVPASKIGWTLPDGSRTTSDPVFATDANAVMPWLEKCRSWKAESYGNNGVWVIVDAPIFEQGYAPTFARAAAIALIRAKRNNKA